HHQARTATRRRRRSSNPGVRRLQARSRGAGRSAGQEGQSRSEEGQGQARARRGSGRSPEKEAGKKGRSEKRSSREAEKDNHKKEIEQVTLIPEGPPRAGLRICVRRRFDRAYALWPTLIFASSTSTTTTGSPAFSRPLTPG